jgi:hypothetical protein
MVGRACEMPLRKLCTKGERAVLSAVLDFLVSNMKLSNKLGIAWDAGFALQLSKTMS